MKCPSPRATVLLLLAGSLSASAQPYSPPDREQPGDGMIQQYLAHQAQTLHSRFFTDLKSREQWEENLPVYRQQFLYMLGLDPMPEPSPLQATVTRTLQREDFAVEMVHFQSRPGLYVTGNLYRPLDHPPNVKLPAVVYVCGHSYQGRSGNKTAYQSHGIWFARHGYLCLVLDTLQLGEIPAIHHGTYRENRWWWHSRGYTPAGVECLNGIRAVDYLLSRPEVDPARIAVTGISGGGAATFWIAAADPRIAVAVPVSGMADLPSYVENRVVDGHCDCMFLYNTFQWPWTRIASLIAPRPLLFVNSDADPIFPMDANERVSNRLERLYSLYGRSDLVESFVSIGDHAYRADIRQAAYRFINTHLKNDPRTVADSERNLITGDPDHRHYPIPIDDLRVFPTDQDVPTDQLNTTIDQCFVPMAKITAPEPDTFEPWKTALLGNLRKFSFHYYPDIIPVPQARPGGSSQVTQLETEPGIQTRLIQISPPSANLHPSAILLGVANNATHDRDEAQLRASGKPGDALFLCEPRGIGSTAWTRKNPPNTVERSLVLLGQTADSGRLLDVLGTIAWLNTRYGSDTRLVLVGEGNAAILAAYAALLDPTVDAVVLKNPPASHQTPDAPQFLNVLRVCDIPQVLGMLAPRPLSVSDADPARLSITRQAYRSAHAEKQLVLE